MRNKKNICLVLVVLVCTLSFSACSVPKPEKPSVNSSSQLTEAAGEQTSQKYENSKINIGFNYLFN